jgi:hypothetical protein
MLSRLAFHQLKQQLYPVKSLNKTETGTDEPSIEEVEGFLSKYGAKLLITDTLHMLKEFYGIEIGDFIIVKKPSNIPARVVRIINNVFCFKVSDIRKDFSGIEVRLYLNMITIILTMVIPVVSKAVFSIFLIKLISLA